MFFFILQSLFWFLLFFFAGFLLGKWLKKLLCKDKHRQETNTGTTSTEYRGGDEDDNDKTVYLKTSSSQSTLSSPASDAYNAAMLEKTKTSDKSKLAAGAATATLATTAYKAYATQKSKQTTEPKKTPTTTHSTKIGKAQPDVDVEKQTPKPKETNTDDIKHKVVQETKPTQPQSLLHDEHEKIVPSKDKEEDLTVFRAKTPATDANETTTVNFTNNKKLDDKTTVVERIDAERDKTEQTFSTAQKDVSNAIDIETATANITSSEKQDDKTTVIEGIDAEIDKAEQTFSTAQKDVSNAIDIETTIANIASNDKQEDKTIVVETAHIGSDKVTRPQTLLGDQDVKLTSNTRTPEMGISESKDAITRKTPTTSVDRSHSESSSDTASQDPDIATNQQQISDNDKANIAINTEKTDTATEDATQTTATTKALGAAAITGAAGILAATTKAAKDKETEGSHTKDAIAQEQEKQEPTPAITDKDKPAPLDTSNFDPLQIIEGIGGTMEQLLYRSGIDTWKKLSLQSNSDLRTLLDKEGNKYKGVQTEGWIEQAKLAASGKFADLVRLQKIDGQSKVERKFSYLLDKKTTIYHDKDDLKLVIGIGPKVMELLNNAGIYTFKELSHTSIERLQKILDDGGSNFRITEPETWPEQAKLADQQEWEKLRQYKGHLN